MDENQRKSWEWYKKWAAIEAETEEVFTTDDFDKKYKLGTPKKEEEVTDELKFTFINYDIDMGEAKLVTFAPFSKPKWNKDEHDGVLPNFAGVPCWK